MTEILLVAYSKDIETLALIVQAADARNVPVLFFDPEHCLPKNYKLYWRVHKTEEILEFATKQLAKSRNVKHHNYAVLGDKVHLNQNSE